MTNIIAVFDILNPFIKIGASIVGIISFSVYYYATKDIDWGETDETQE
jgi:hypothetical protein